MTPLDLLAETDKFVAGGSIAMTVPLRTLVKELAADARLLRLGVIEIAAENARLSALVESLSERCHGQSEALASRAEIDMSEVIEDATTLTVIAERDHLAKFKVWVHEFLDGKGIPHHPPGTHGAEGCRIGDRMDFVFTEIDRLRADKARLLALIESCRGRCASPDGKEEDKADG